MLSGEDFGYLRDKEQNRLSSIVKKSLLFGAALFSISCFIYITVNAYYFVYSDRSSNIKIIHSPTEPIKIVDNSSENTVKDIDKTIYDSIVGNKNLAHENLNRITIIDKAETPVLSEDAQKEISKKEVSNPQIKTQKVSSSNMMVFESNGKNLNEKPKEQIFDEKKSISSTITNESTQISNTSKGNSKVVRVQIAAMTSKDSAIDYWSKLRRSYPTIFSNLGYFISEANLGVKGMFYRLQVGNFRGQIDAEEFCHKFISQVGKSKADCIIVE